MPQKNTFISDFISLDKLNPGDKAKVVSIEKINDFDKQKFFGLGIIEGTQIEALYRSPFGNPTAYLIRGTVFALRNETAEKITVEKI